MKNYYQPEIETMPLQQLQALQSERLVAQVRHVWDNVPYYRQKMEEKGVTPDDIKSTDDLYKLPFLSKKSGSPLFCPRGLRRGARRSAVPSAHRPSYPYIHRDQLPLRSRKGRQPAERLPSRPPHRCRERC